MINNHLISVGDVFELSRSISDNLDKRVVERYIEEAEQLDLKPNIGTALLARLLNGEGDSADNRMLLYGGQYTSQCGVLASFAGLRKALAYYTYARIVKGGGQTATRFGFVDKRDDNSYSVEYKERLNAANDAGAVADAYLKETVEYLRCEGAKYPEYAAGGGIKNNRVKIKIIGQ